LKSGELEAAERKPDLRERLELLLEQSGLTWTLQKLAIMSAVSRFILMLPGAIIQRSIVFALLGALLGSVIPWLYVKFKRKLRLDALGSQLPEAYDLMARGLRAGQTIAMTMKGVAEEFPQPIAGEFAYCYEQQNLGLAADVS